MTNPSTPTPLLRDAVPAPASGPTHVTARAAWWAIAPTAILAWSAVQACSLALALLQVPLSATYPTGTVLTLEVVSAGQVGGAALMCPLLFRTPATAAVVLGSAWPALLLAGGIAARPLDQTAFCGAIVSTWLATLFVWTSMSDDRRWGQVVAAAATLLSIGGALLAYLAAEFASAGEPVSSFAPIANATPLILTWTLSHSATSIWDDGLLLPSLFFVGALARLASHARRRRAALGSTATLPRSEASF